MLQVFCFTGSEGEANMKNHADALIFHMSICAEVSQICPDATKKSPARISSSHSFANASEGEGKYESRNWI